MIVVSKVTDISNSKMLFDHLPESARHAYPCLSPACLRWPCLLPYSLHLVSCWSSVWLWALRCGCNPYIDTLWLSLISIYIQMIVSSRSTVGMFNIVVKFFNGQSVRMWKQLADRKKRLKHRNHWASLDPLAWRVLEDPLARHIWKTLPLSLCLNLSNHVACCP